MSAQTLDFTDLSPIEEEVKIPGRFFDDDKQRTRNYVMREVSADGARAFRNAKFGAVRFNDQGNPVGMGNLADLEIILIQHCLFEPNANGVGRVTKSCIEKWPGQVTKRLYERAFELSKDALREEEPDKDKLRQRIAEALAVLVKPSAGKAETDLVMPLIGSFEASAKAALTDAGIELTEEPAAKKPLLNGTPN